MLNFISRIQLSKPNPYVTGAVLNRDAFMRWQCKFLEENRKEPTLQDLLAELEAAVDQYNQSLEPRVV